MNITQYDAHNNQQISIEVDGPNYGQTIKGDGWFIIVNPHSEYVSFSKQRHDVCFGDATKDIIREYTNQQYADEYGSRLTGVGKTVKEYMQQYCRMNIK